MMAMTARMVTPTGRFIQDLLTLLAPTRRRDTNYLDPRRRGSSGRMIPGARILSPAYPCAGGALLPGFPAAQRRYLDLLRQPIGRRDVAVTFHKRSADQCHRVVRRGDLRHPIRYRSLPARSG